MDSEYKIEWIEISGADEANPKGCEGRRWSTRLDIPTARALRDSGWDFVDSEAFAERIKDPLDAADFVVDYHRKQWETILELSEEEFLGIIFAEEGRFESVLEATLHGAADFLSRRGDKPRAALLRKIWTATQAASEACVEQLNSSKFDDAIAASIESGKTQFEAELQAMTIGGNSESSSENGEARSTE